jgi:hypothetical protein
VGGVHIHQRQAFSSLAHDVDAMQSTDGIAPVAAPSVPARLVCNVTLCSLDRGGIRARTESRPINVLDPLVQSVQTPSETGTEDRSRLVADGIATGLPVKAIAAIGPGTLADGRVSASAASTDRRTKSCTVRESRNRTSSFCGWALASTRDGSRSKASDIGGMSAMEEHVAIPLANGGGQKAVPNAIGH